MYNNRIILFDQLRKEFGERFAVLTMGNFCWLIRALATTYTGHKVVWFLPEMNEQFDTNFFAALDFWVPERNEIGHYQINLDEGEI